MIDPFSLILGGAAVAWAYKYFNDSGQEDYSEPELQMMVVASFLYMVAEADGHIHEREVDLIKSLFREVIVEAGGTIDDSRLDSCLNACRNNQQIQQVLVGHARENADYRVYLLRSAWRIAAKDGKVTDEEIEFIVRAGMTIEATQEEFLICMLPYCRQTRNPAMLQAARTVLGLEADASPAEIKKKYRTLANKYHPDKFRTENAVVAEMAAEKFRQITEAYELLTGASDTHDFVLNVDRTGVSKASAHGYCRCYFCGQKVKLPPIAHIETARCAKCQALLAFDQTLAQSLLDIK